MKPISDSSKRQRATVARALAALILIGLCFSTLQVQANRFPLQITEIMYNPQGGSAYEFLEIQNTGDTEIDLSQAVWSGIELRFPAQSIIPPGAIWLLAADEDSAAFQTRYPGTAPVAEFGRNLANGGELLVLRDVNGQTLAWADYDDEGFWPVGADGQGFSLERSDVTDDPTSPSSWRLSSARDGSPGLPNPNAQQPTVRINELFATASAEIPSENDWVELFNSGTVAVDLTGWRLTDSANNPAKYTLPSGTSIPAGGFLRIDFNATAPDNNLNAPFALSSLGETVFLYDAAGLPVDALRFGRQLPGHSLGRIDGAWTLNELTPLEANRAANTANPNALVINEWQADAGNGNDDFIEILNTDASLPVNLTGICIGHGGIIELAPEEVVVTEFAAEWRLFKGTEDPSPDDFRLWTRDESITASWEVLPAPFHLGAEETRGTELTDLPGNYSSILMQRNFSVLDRDSFDTFLVRVSTDDGFIVWFNGSEWGRLNIDFSILSVDAVATEDRNGFVTNWEFELDNFQEFLHEGANNVSMQAVALNQNDDDFYADLALVGVKPPQQAFSFAEVAPFPFHSFIPAGDLLVLAGDDDDTAEALPFRLPAEGSSIALVDDATNILDTQTYTVASEGLSEGRFPDGGDEIVFFEDGATPGQPNGADTDGDSIPDHVERALGLDPNNPADGNDDLDRDGVSNRQEFLSGTDLLDPASFFSVMLSGNRTADSFEILVPRLADRSYSLQMADRIDGNEWIQVADVLQQGAAAGELMAIEIPIDQPQAYFRLVSPPQLTDPELIIAGQNPEPGASAYGTNQTIELDLRLPLDPASLSAENLWTLQDEFGRSQSVEVRYEDLFSRVQLRPAIPLRPNATYQVSVAPEVQTQSGVPVADLIPAWSFTTADSAPIQEDRSIYNADTDGVLRIDVAVEEGATPFTLEDLLNDRFRDDEFDPEIRVRVTGDTFAPTVFGSNATMQVRGATTRLAIQKSFRIDLDNDEERWRGHRRINLIKHPFELTRLRNRLSFELFEQIPNFTSLRTQFVHLFINGEDQGLYSQIESYGDRFLSEHGLDEDAHLYKANFFEWFRYADQLKLTSDPTYDRDEFERILEVETRNDHEKLLQLVTDVNDFDLDFNTVFKQYFNQENYLTWLAINLLIGNIDTNSQNFFIYSPSDSQTWYLLPWDYDGAWGLRRQPDNVNNIYPRWQEGLATYWNVTLHKRFMQDPANRALLEAKMTELMNSQLTESNIRSVINRYRDTIRPFVTQPPDVHQLPITNEVVGDSAATIAQWDGELDRIATEVQFNYNLYRTVLKRPMPVHLRSPRFLEDTVTLRWTESFHFDGSPLHYDLEVGTSPGFEEESLVTQVFGITETSYELTPLPESGQYYYRVLIRETANPETNWQIAFRSFFDPDQGRSFFGLRPFEVP